MALRRGSSREEVYHRMILNPVGSKASKYTDPASITEFISQIADQIAEGQRELRAARGGLGAKQCVLQATRLCYVCMKRHGVIYRTTTTPGLEAQRAMTTGANITDKNVRDAIDGERDYQNNLGPDRSDGADRSVSDYLLMMKVYCRKAEEGWVACPGDYDSLDQIRKVCAIGVRCLEEAGITSL
jgi:hypothetical protein